MSTGTFIRQNVESKFNIETNIAESMQRKFVPYYDSLNRAIDFYEQRMTTARTETDKNFCEKMLAELVDVKEAKANGTIEILDTTKFSNGNHPKPYGYLTQVLRKHFKQIQTGEISLHQVVKDNDLNYNSASREMSRLRKEPEKAVRVSKSEQAHKLIKENLSDIESEKISLLKLGRDNNISGSLIGKIYKNEFKLK